MRIVFMGTPEFAARIMEKLASEHEVVAAYTMPDKVRGRGRKTAPSPVKETAERLGIPVETPSTLKDPNLLDVLAGYAPDVVCVAAYGRILPQDVLDLPQYGCINVHASLLPRWRGAAPIERAVLAADEKAGVSIMRMEAGLDTGDWCIQRSVDAEGRCAADLTADIAEIGAEALCEALDLIEAGNVRWTKQDDSEATYAEKIGKGELDLDPSASAEENVRRVLASGEAHPSRISLAGSDAAVLAAACAGDDESVCSASGIGSMPETAPGSIVATKKRLFLRAQDGWMEVMGLKPSGKKAMDARAYLAGARLAPDARWGRPDA